MPGGKPWIKVDLNAVGKQAGIDLSQFTQLGTDPSRMVDWLRTVSGDVTTVGTEKLDGVDTTHYRATVDLSKYPDLVPADQREAVQQGRSTSSRRPRTSARSRCTSGSTRAASSGRCVRC